MTDPGPTVVRRAPADYENQAGPRIFTYLAEVDILGWKFRAMKDGGFQIDLPYLPDGGAPVMSLTDDQRRVLAALIAMPDSFATSTPQFNPSTAPGVGS